MSNESINVPDVKEVYRKYSNMSKEELKRISEQLYSDYIDRVNKLDISEEDKEDLLRFTMNSMCVVSNLSALEVVDQLLFGIKSDSF